MKRLFSTAATAGILGALAVLSECPTAEAGEYLSNGTSNTIFAAQNRVNVCDWECPNGWLAIGWYQINPGGTAYVFTGSYSSLLFTFFAEDNFGHSWHGSLWQNTLCTPFSAFQMCNPLMPACSGVPSPNRMLTYGQLDTPNYCCGGFFSCGLDTSETINLTL